MIGDVEECAAFEKNDFIRIADIGKVTKVLFDINHVRNQELDYLRPGLIKGFIPNGGTEDFLYFHLLRCLHDLSFPLFEHSVPFTFLDFVHLMN